MCSNNQTFTEASIIQYKYTCNIIKRIYLSDRISNEMIKSSVDILMKGFIKVFNTILNSGNFPSLWCEGLITLLKQEIN